MRLAAIYVLILLSSFNAVAQQDSVENKIILVGDAGALVNGKATTIDAIKKLMPLDEKTTVIFLGDNLYHDGLPPEELAHYDAYRSVLDSQVALVANTKATAYVIPGNHDWENGRKGGYEAIIRQQRYIDNLKRPNVFFYPKDGCPGPEEINIGKDAVLIIMDSQWWLHANEKPGVESDCKYKTKQEVLGEIENILTANSKKLVIFACHHPFRSNGIHGGYFGVKQHIFPFTDLNKHLYIPLPFIGSIYPISRSVFGSPQDLKHPTYENMVRDVETVVKAHPNVIFVHGHEHNMQLIKDSSYHYIVSGAGCKQTRVEKSKHSAFVSSSLGFVTLDIAKSKNVRVNFYTSGPDSVGLMFTKNILNFSTLPKRGDTIPSTVPVYVHGDSALVPASKQYETRSNLQVKGMGNNYRAEWNTPVKMKVFNIAKEKGGMKIVSVGGGKQTKSLTLKDKDGAEWKLRTIDKDPSIVIPEGMRTTVAKDILQDVMSAAHPYAPMAVPVLAKAAGVQQAEPELFFIPDDPALGLYKNLFANKVCLLEKKDPTEDNSETKSTAKVINKMLDDNDHAVDQNEVLKARLLDVLTGDWDRHFDQWRWEIKDTGKGKLYYPIPRDRDMAFFHSDGLIVNYITFLETPYLHGLQYNIPRVKWLSYSARDFDRTFLNRLSALHWQRVICEFQNNITDSSIQHAVNSMPAEIVGIHGKVIADKLKSRRELLMPRAMKYYEFLSKYVNVSGSNQKEYFKVSRDSNLLNVRVYATDKKGDTSFLMYDRSFDPKITKEVRLFGLNDDDVFTVDADVRSKIKLRIIGGAGNDTYNLDGRISKRLYDVSTQENTINSSAHTINLMSRNPVVNAYTVKDYKYQDVVRFPLFSVGYNVEDGVLAGVGLLTRSYGFRKQPFATENRLTTLYSFFGKAYQVKYRGTFNDIYRQLDLVINADFQNPTLTSFFGLGNNTEKIPDINLRYNLVRYKYITGDALIRKRFFNYLTVSAGPTFYHYWNNPEVNKNRVLSNPEAVGLDSTDIFTRKTYFGAKFIVDLNNLNSELFPTRGIHWRHELSAMAGLNNNTNNITRYQTDMAVYASLSDPAKVVAVLRFGGGHIFSDNFEYFQALTLGSNSYLRGYRKNRFSGSSSFYNSVELRIKLTDIRSTFLPGTLGVIGFNDIGRVWMKNETSKRWHNAYGGGLYYIPYHLFIVSATVGLSPEEKLINFALGTKINLTF